MVPVDKTYEVYCQDILSGKIKACRQVIQAVQRHVDDLGKIGPDYPYHFDKQAADFAIDFFAFCHHSKGEWAGKKIILEPWQQFIVAAVFGWKKKSGFRRFQTAYVQVARKNGKSTMLAGLGLLGLFLDGENGSEIYSAAVDKDQAKIIWEEARRMVQQSPDFKKDLELFQNTIVHNDSFSKFVPLSSDLNSKDGLNVHFGLVDEYHKHRNDEMYNLLRSGMSARRQPILWIITTAGHDTACACKREAEKVERILNGIEVQDDYFGIIYTLDKEDDWTDPDNWIKANPNLGISKQFDVMLSQCKDARTRAEKEQEFKVKNLNIWVETYTSWIGFDAWKLCGKKALNFNDYIGRKCFTAFDLSTTNDLAGFCHIFPEDDGTFSAFWRYFCPADTVQDRKLKEGLPYDIWVRDGYITATPGNVIDYDEIEKAFLLDAEIIEVIELPHDPWNGIGLINHLSGRNFNCVKFPQNIGFISPAVKATEKIIYEGKLNHGNNPVSDYMITCCETWRDANDNVKLVKPDRSKSNKRIDGIIMLIMALHRAALAMGQDDSFVYKDRGMLTL